MKIGKDTIIKGLVTLGGLAMAGFGIFALVKGNGQSEGDAIEEYDYPEVDSNSDSVDEE